MTDRDVRCVRPTSPESPRVALSIFKRIYIVSREALCVNRDAWRYARAEEASCSARRKTRYLNRAHRCILYILGTYHVLEVRNLPILLKAISAIKSESLSEGRPRVKFQASDLQSTRVYAFQVSRVLGVKRNRSNYYQRVRQADQKCIVCNWRERKISDCN